MKTQKVAIVTDGASSIIPTEGEGLGVHVAPVYVTFDEQTYRSGVDLDATEFYNLLRSNKRLPTTAQPTAKDFVDLYTKLAKEVDEIVAVVISHHMSATLQSAQMAQEQFTDIPVHVFDSESATVGLGMMTIAAARAAEQGQDADSILQLLERIRQNLDILFTVDTLEYLHKGGRIGGATAFLGAALNIKPIMHVEKGRIEPLERTRTRKRAIARLLELVEEKVTTKEAHFAILHCTAENEAHELGELVKERFNCVDLFISEAGPVIGTHAGPGTLGIAYYTLD